MTAAKSSGRTVRAAVTLAIAEARDAGRIKPWHEPAAAVAMKLATALNPAKLASTELVRLSNELDKMLSRLPLAEETTPNGGSGDGPATPAGSAGPGDPRSPRLASVVGSSPEVGDTALPA
jgi:hypothetical protein